MIVTITLEDILSILTVFVLIFLMLVYAAQEDKKK